MALPGTSIGSLGASGLTHQAIKSESNPFDKATVFSIFPREIRETKPTIQPGRFIIPAGTPDNPARLVVGPSSWWRVIDPEQPLLEIPVPSVHVADSLVRDYCNAKLGSNMADAMPGLFYLPGDISIQKLVKEFSQVLERAKARQTAWYLNLVKLADAFWARSNGNPIAIDDHMRLAAKELGLQRDWVAAMVSMDLIKCVACGNMRNPTYPICPHCKAIVDPAKAKELNLTFAQ